MSRNVNPYEAPFTREQYEYAKQMHKLYEIDENVKIFGPLGEAEGDEWTEEDMAWLKGDKVRSGEAEPEGFAPMPEESAEEEYDPDDVAFVDGLAFNEKQAWLKSQDPPLSAAGDKPTLRHRMLEALKAQNEELEEEEDEDED